MVFDQWLLLQESHWVETSSFSNGPRKSCYSFLWLWGLWWWVPYEAWWRSCQEKGRENVKAEARHHLRGRENFWRKHQFRGAPMVNFVSFFYSLLKTFLLDVKIFIWMKQKKDVFWYLFKLCLKVLWCFMVYLSYTPFNLIKLPIFLMIYLLSLLSSFTFVFAWHHQKRKIVESKGNLHLKEESWPLIILFRCKQIQRLKVVLCVWYFISDVLKTPRLMFQTIGRWSHDLI